MITIGLATLFRSIIGLIWGHDVYPFKPFPETPLDFFNLTILPVELTTCIVVVGLVIPVFLFFHYSRLGIAMRATAFNQKYALSWESACARFSPWPGSLLRWWHPSGDLSRRDVPHLPGNELHRS